MKLSRFIERASEKMVRTKTIKTKWMRLAIVVFLSATFFASLLSLSGCGKNQKEEDKVTITLSFFDRLEKWQGITDGFMKKNPNIKVAILQFPGSYMEKISTMFAAGDPPDVIFTAEKGAEFASREILLDLTPYIERDKEEMDLSDIYPQFLENCKYQGRYFGLPVNSGADVIFYNKNLFDNAGLNYPDEDLTYEKMIEIAQKLTKDTDSDGRIDQYGLFMPWNSPWILGHVLKWGGEIFNPELTECLVDSPESIEAIQWYLDLIKKYKISPSLIALGTQSDLQFFMTSKIAMFDGMWYHCQFFKDIKDFVWDIAPVPERKDGSRISYGGINRLVISKKTKNLEASWKLVKYITGKEGQEYFLKGGYDTPIRKSVSKLILTLTDYPENRKVFIDSMEYSRLIPEFPKKGETIEIFTQEFDNILFKDVPVQEGCKRIAERVNKILEGRD